MTNSVFGKLFDTIMNFINLFRFWIVLDEFERGVILRFGRFHKKVGPGFHWRRPLSIDRLLWLNIRKKTTDSWEMTLTSLDNKAITISFDMVMEVHDAEKALLTVDDWVCVAYTTVKIILSNAVTNTNAFRIMESKFSERAHLIINSTLNEFGINISAFGITDKALTRSYRLFTGASK